VDSFNIKLLDQKFRTLRKITLEKTKVEKKYNNIKKKKEE
jgi:hypothetical protein